MEITHFSHRVFCNLSPFAFVGKVVADFGEEVRFALVEDKIFSRKFESRKPPLPMMSIQRSGMPVWMLRSVIFRLIRLWRNTKGITVS